MEGVTVLYIPKEGADLPVDVAAKNKELVQRLESILKEFKIIKKFNQLLGILIEIFI